MQRPNPRPFHWCDHCNAHIREDAVKACLRKSCETKGRLDQKPVK